MATADATRGELPIILVRGFGGLDVGDEKKLAYYGFNDGTVYPQKRGENYIYEGMILRFLKSVWRYQDATNVIGYYSKVIADARDIPKELKSFPKEFFIGNKIVVDPAMALVLRKNPDPRRTMWVFRYYDLDDRNFAQYGVALKRLIELVRRLVTLKTGEDAAEGQHRCPLDGWADRAADPAGGLRTGRGAEVGEQGRHPGHAAQGHHLPAIREPEVAADARSGRGDRAVRSREAEGCPQQDQLHEPAKPFPLDRFLTVIGTNYRTFGTVAGTCAQSHLLGRGRVRTQLQPQRWAGEDRQRRDPGAPRTFVHKCHGGPDSLITSREAFEVATRFFHGDIHASLRLQDARITRGRDFLGKSEFFIGISLKPRGVDFDLFHQSKDAENCYGPFSRDTLDDEKVTFDWIGADRKRRLLWEGWLDSGAAPADADDLVMRLETYVGERDLFGIGFSDNLIFHSHCYVQAKIDPKLRLAKHISEVFPDAGLPLKQNAEQEWLLPIEGDGFKATFAIGLSFVPDVGERALV